MRVFRVVARGINQPVFLTLALWHVFIFCAPSTAWMTSLYTIPARDNDGSMSQMARIGARTVPHGSSDRSAGFSLRETPPCASGIRG